MSEMDEVHEGRLSVVVTEDNVHRKENGSVRSTHNCQTAFK